MREAGRRRAGAVGALCATLAGGAAFGHDEAASPHLRCALDGSDTLICVYDRHATGPERTSRAGYADKGRYMFSCVQGDSDNRAFSTEICRAGTGPGTAFACWTQERLEGWLGASEENEAAAREATTDPLVVTGAGLQETLIKFLVDPARVGRPNFVAGSATGPSGIDIRDYARTCGIGTQGAFTAQDLVNLLPTLALFGHGAPR